MAPVDVMMCASIAAYFATLNVSIFAERKLRIYTVFIGKKYAKLVHVSLVLLSGLQALAVAVMASRSEWRVSALPLLGIPLVAASVYWLWKQIAKHKIASAVYVQFLIKQKTTRKAVPFLPHPIYVAIATLYASSMVATGRYGYGIACLWVLILATFTSVAMARYQQN